MFYFLLLVENFFIVFIFHWFHDRLLSALVVSLLLMAPLALACSALAFQTLTLWVYFLPLLLLVLTFQLYEIAQDYRKEWVSKVARSLKGKPSGVNPAAPPNGSDGNADGGGASALRLPAGSRAGAGNSQGPSVTGLRLLAGVLALLWFGRPRRTGRAGAFKRVRKEFQR